MKAILWEHDNAFQIELTPENGEEALDLVRIGMGATKEVSSIETYVTRRGTVNERCNFYLSIKKRVALSRSSKIEKK